MLNQLEQDGLVRFHHDGFEFNDGAMPPHDFDLQSRLDRYASVDRLVYLERDPRDVMVSLYHQVTGRFRDFFGYNGSLSDFIHDPYFGAANLARFRELWSVIVPRYGFLKVTYEGCHRDPPGTLARICAYYGFQVPSSDIERAARAADIETMREVELSGAFSAPWLRPRNGSTKVRGGVVGGYLQSLRAEDVAYLDQLFAIE